MNHTPRPGKFRAFLTQLWALVRGRCPRCREGRVFHGLFAMNDPCPVCGLVFEREPGYFLGSMYFSYPIGAVFLGGVYYLLGWLRPDWDGTVLVFLALLAYLPLIPAVFQYS